MTRPITELIACGAEVCTYTVRSACVTVTPTVSNETSALKGSNADASCNAAGQCGFSFSSRGQLAQRLNANSVQNGGGSGGAFSILKSTASKANSKVFAEPSGKSNR